MVEFAIARRGGRVRSAMSLFTIARCPTALVMANAVAATVSVSSDGKDCSVAKVTNTQVFYLFYIPKGSALGIKISQSLF